MEYAQWPYAVIFARLSLALAIGLFIGLERERRGKDAGLRTFGFAALMGALGGLLGDMYAALAIVLLGILIIFLNLQTLKKDQGTELTTSIALLLTGFVGILSGKGHTLTPAAVGVTTAALLAWKESLAGFSLKLSETEVRSAILLAILAFVIYPALPEGSIDPWGALEPRAAWITVILIAGIGFINYILLKVYGNRGIELTGFLGGLVNSSVATRELAQRSYETQGHITDFAYRGILLAVAAMVVRNAVLLAILAPDALVTAAASFALMFIASIGLAFFARKPSASEANELDAPLIHIQSPFSLKSALKFGALLVIIQVAGIIGQQVLGQFGVYVASFLGGLFSSSSAVAAAAALAAHGTISTQVAGTCAVLASITSVVVNLPLIFGLASRKLIARLSWAVGFVALMGYLGEIIQTSLFHMR